MRFQATGHLISVKKDITSVCMSYFVASTSLLRYPSQMTRKEAFVHVVVSSYHRHPEAQYSSDFVLIVFRARRTGYISKHLPTPLYKQNTYTFCCSEN